MAKEIVEKYFASLDEWQLWLEKNHKSSQGIWLIFYKKHTGKASIPYDDAVEEALCYGWIDSIVKKLDDDRYVRKFTPRKDKSVWSELNKKRATRMIKQGRMKEIGLQKIEIAKKNGQWNKGTPAEQNFEMPVEFADALAMNPKAKTFFDSLAPSHKKMYIGWIASAKREQTRQNRSQEAITLLLKNQNLPMK